MTVRAQVICDSTWQGQRLTTLELRYPRMIHAEFMTHRAFSRNASSSRAIPVERLIQDVLDDPYIPVHWGKNQKGMQARQEHDERVIFNEDQPGSPLCLEPSRAWLRGRDAAVDLARRFAKAGYHKQIVNRLLEPFAHINVVCTATDWDNFFAQRRHPDAQPEMKALADAMWCAMQVSAPRERAVHLPYTTWEDEDQMLGALRSLELISAARCARVSYKTHDGRWASAQEEIQLARKLITEVHPSPFEHQAYAAEGRHANFNGWRARRLEIFA